MNRFVISFSYGNYLIQNGGTDKVIREQKELFNNHDITYFFLFPVIRVVRIGGYNRKLKYWGLNIDKEFIGLYNIYGIRKYILSYIGDNNHCVGIFVHHVWRIEQTDLDIILGLINSPIFYYLHDFHAICDAKNFINSNNEYCGFDIDSNVCTSNCSYFAQSILNRKRMTEFIEKYFSRLLLIAPSENTRDIYRKVFPRYTDSLITIPHQKESGQYLRASQEQRTRLKVAFIGKQTEIKGWNDYRIIVQTFSDSNDYEFYYLGTGEECLSNVKSISVSVREQGADAMLNTLRENDIDIVLLLSHCPETYSYTYYEAYASGCFVITYRYSGNIVDMIKKVGNGITVNEYKEIIDFLSDHRSLTEIIDNSSFRAPLSFLPNDYIISLLDKTQYDTSDLIVNNQKASKKKVASCLYRLINRRKLHESKYNI